MLFKKCYCLDLCKYDEVNCSFRDVRLEAEYYSNTPLQRDASTVGVCVQDKHQVSLASWTNAELFLKTFIVAHTPQLQIVLFYTQIPASSGRFVSETLINKQWKAKFQTPFSTLFCFVWFLSAHTLLEHSYQLSVCPVGASAAGCSTVITHWMGIAISGSGTRVTIMGSKHAAAAGGNGASMSEETDFTSEMKSSERECLSFSTSLVCFSTYLVCRKYCIIQSLFEKQEKKKDCR